MNRSSTPFPRSVSEAALLAVLALALASPARADSRYQKTNLVSDVPGLGAVTDSNLVNAWGLTRSATSPWWVADNGTGVSTLYNGAGTKLALTVTVPPPAMQPPPSAPSGTVFNGTADFELAAGKPARFLFATENGTISGWNPGVDPVNAVTKVDNSGQAIYKGLTIGQISGANYLYAANFHAGTVDVFDRTYAPVSLGASAFQDPKLPAGYAPFNVQALGDKIAVTFAEQDSAKMDDVPGPGRGYVDLFTTSGMLVTRLRSGRWMNAPWGVAWAPAGFGRLSGMILVGQFGSGHIAAFDPATGLFRGLLQADDGYPLQVDGLWALGFGNGANAGPATTLFFTAGIDAEAHGLFGTITLLPEAPDDDED